MSDTDSFIEEVTEEVRRDRLFALMRRYGWIAVVAVLLLVGGTAYREYTRAAETAKAQAFGDAILAALENDAAADRVSALDQIEAPTSISITSFTVTVARAKRPHMEKSISCASARVSASIRLLYGFSRPFIRPYLARR